MWFFYLPAFTILMFPTVAVHPVRHEIHDFLEHTTQERLQRRAEEQYQPVAYTVELKRFALSDVDKARQYFMQKKSAFDQKVLYSLIAAGLIGTAGVGMYMSGGAPDQRGSDAPVREQAVPQDPTFFRQVQNWSAVAIGLALGGVVMSSLIPVGAYLRNSSQFVINMLLHGYEYWYYDKKESLEVMLHSLRELLERARLMQSSHEHDHRIEYSDKEEPLVKYHRANIVNYFNSCVRRFEQLVALMELVAGKELAESSHLYADEIGARINELSIRLEQDLNRYDNGYAPYYTKKTLDLFLMVEEQIMVFIHDFEDSHAEEVT